jgi:hypothetical protein
MKKPKLLLTWGIGAALLVGVLNFPTASSGQAPGDEPAVMAVIAELAAQQEKMSANQQVLEQKLAVVEENLRLARIFVSRGGPIKQ